MSDVIDMACDREQEDRARAIAQALNHDDALPAIGSCYNCEAQLPKGLRFCDCDCRDDYATRKRCEALR